MTPYRFLTADVFTSVMFGGNQLAVLPDARGLSDSRMQQIAGEFNLSETAFVLPPSDPRHTRRVRIFTPRVELPFAGHPTIGTAQVLASLGEITLQDENTEAVLEEGVGPVRVVIRARAGKPDSVYLSAARLPEFGPTPPATAIIAKSLSLEEEHVMTDEVCPASVSCGVPFLFVPVRDRSVLGRASIDREHWNKHLRACWAPHLYVFCFDPERDGSDLRARMFAPAMGVDEDPATGAAATALAGYLGVRDSLTDGILHWRVEQGFEMGRPSILEIQAEKKDGEIVAVRVGGQSVLVSEGTIYVPDA